MRRKSRRTRHFRYAVQRCRVGLSLRGWTAAENRGPGQRRGYGVRAKYTEAVARALELWRAGTPTATIAKELAVPRSTVRYWLLDDAGVAQSAEAIALKAIKWGFESPHQHQHRAYAYLLGAYLGDGCIAPNIRTYFLRIYLHRKQTDVIHEVLESIRTVLPHLRPWLRHRPKSPVVEVTSSFLAWPAVLPQHGPGRKHSRPIVLRPWQREIVAEHAGDFLRGLIDTDGCRHRRIVNGKNYPAFSFSNRSSDISGLFRRACYLVGVGPRQATAITTSIARRPDVARIDAVMADRQFPLPTSSLD